MYTIFGAKFSLAHIFGWVLLAVAYSCLIPGLIYPLYFYQISGKVFDKTMFKTIDLVYTNGGLFPTILVAFFGLAVPAIKLILIILSHTLRKPILSKIVLIVSKWAIVDAIVATMIMAYFTFALQGKLIAQVSSGFTFFVLYCTLSTLAALLLDDRDKSFQEIQAQRTSFLRAYPFDGERTVAGLSVIIAGCATIASLLLDTIKVGMPSEPVSMSVLYACQRLVTEMHPDPRPMALLLICVVIIPLTEIMFLGTMVFVPINTFTTRFALRAFPHCGMLDVYAISMIVMVIFLKAMGQMSVSIPPVGYSVLGFALFSTIFARLFVGRFMSKKFGTDETIERKPTTGLLEVHNI